MKKENKLELMPDRINTYNDIAEQSEKWIKLYWAIIKDNWNKPLSTSSRKYKIFDDYDLEQLNKEYSQLLRF